jgi:hypothetical protein
MTGAVSSRDSGSRAAASFDERPWLIALSVMSLVSVVVAFGVGLRTGIPALSIVLTYAFAVLLLAPFSLPLLLLGFVIHAAFRRVQSPIAELRRLLKARFATRRDMLTFVVPLVMIPLTMGAFGTLKQAIPLVTPFTWDDIFADADRLIFFGRQPWELTHWLFGGPHATVAIDVIYTQWVPFLFVAVMWVALAAPPRLRAHFCLAFAACWLLVGGLGAFVFASAGPCFADLLGTRTAPEFTELMARLRGIDANHHEIGALEWQRMLWTSHVQRHYAFALGISAMPSMHNAVCFLYVLAAWRAGRAMRTIAIAFTVLIFIGSVHLGWHYAVDAFAAWGAVAVIWWAVGRFLDRTSLSEQA